MLAESTAQLWHVEIVTSSSFLSRNKSLADICQFERYDVLNELILLVDPWNLN